VRSTSIPPDARGEPFAGSRTDPVDEDLRHLDGLSVVVGSYELGPGSLRAAPRRSRIDAGATVASVLYMTSAH
jgi:hypothetical protein